MAWAEKNGGNTDKLGITGFCWGGRKTWIYSAQDGWKRMLEWFRKYGVA